jgi:hypothetical protein
MLDQDYNTLFQFSTKETVQYGHKKIFLTNSGHQDEYFLIVSSQLKRKMYMASSETADTDNNVFDNSEAYWVLNKVIKKLLSMQIANFGDFLL